MMMSRLDKIEKHIRNLFEKTPGLLPWAHSGDQLIVHLTDALQAQFTENKPREYLRPSAVFAVSPATNALWQKQRGWNETLADLLVSTGAEFGSTMRTFPEVRVISDSNLNEDEIVITLTDSFYNRNSETGIVSLEQLSEMDEPAEKPVNNPSLILFGGRIVELNQPVINIGRKASNHIIISDPRISRVHAQLRRIKDEYMVFDVDSAGGTFINSERIQSHVLRPGDVISLAGYTMIFTIDQHSSGETQKGITAELKSTNKEEE